MIYRVREQLEVYRTTPRARGDLRGFEWYYLANLCDRTPIRLLGHEKAVICVAFHPDGKRVVSGGADGTVRVWDLTGRRAFTSSRAREVWSIAWPSARMAIGWPLAMRGAVSGSGSCETGRERALAGHESGLGSVAFSLDSNHLLSCDVGGLIVQWNVRTGERDFDLRHGHQEEGVSSPENFRRTLANYAPVGQTIVSVGSDHWVKIWDVATRRLRDQVRVGTNIMGFSISPDGRELALAEELTEIEILDLEKPHEPRRLVPGTGNRIVTVTFSPDRRTLAILGYGRKAGLVDAQSSQLLDRFHDQLSLSPFSMAFERQGRMLAMAVGEEVHVVRLARSHEGENVAASLGPICRLAASPDERLLALGREDGTIVVWDVRSNRVLQTLGGHSLAVFGVAFVPGPRGARLVSVGGDGLIQIWDPEAGGQPLNTLLGHSGAIYSLAVRPDGREIATGGEDGKVRTWDPATGRADLPPLDHGASISALAYDPTGTTLASGGMDRTVRVWSATSGRRRLGPLSHPHQLTSLAFSPDGRLLAGGGGATDLGKIQIWDASNGAVSSTVDCPRGVDSLSFSPDSRRIATCGSDAVVQVWDAIGGHETLSLAGHRSRVSAVLFVPPDQRLYSAGRDGVVKLWDGSTTAPAE